MKKLIVTAIGAAAAFGAFADPISTQRFESFNVSDDPVTTNQLNAAGSPAGNGYWFTKADATNNTYKIEATGTDFPESKPFGDDSPTKALNIETEFGKPLNVNIISGGASTDIAETGIYFDSLVKFTVCDGEPELASDDLSNAKIALWVQENEDSTATNLYIKAGYLIGETLQDVGVVTNTYKCMRVDPDFASTSKWHRVTIKAFADITKGNEIPGFVVFVDEVPVNVAGVYNISSIENFSDNLNARAAYWTESLFPSMVQGNDADKVTLKSAGFAGTGSLTDIVFTEEAPSFTVEQIADPPATVVINGNKQEVTDFDSVMTAVNGALAGTNVTVSLIKGSALEAPLVFTTAANVTLDFAGFVITNTQEFAAITNASNLTITNSVGNGGIYCTEAVRASGGVAIYDSAATLTIQGGSFWGNVKLNEGGTYLISGGSFLDDTDFEDFDCLASGKTFEKNLETGMYDVVDADTPTTYTITVADGEHMTIAVTTNDVPAGAAGDYVLNAGDKIEVTYTADTGYTLSKYSDSILSVSAEATIAAPVATLLTYKVIFVDGDAATTNIVNHGAGVGVVPSFVGKTGYTAAWDSDPAEVASVTSDLTFTAVYTANVYTVTFYTNSEEYATANYTYGDASTFSAPSDPSIDGFTFGGWFTDNGTFKAAFTFDETVADNTQVAYAKLTSSGGGIDPTDPTSSQEVTVNDDDIAKYGTPKAAAEAKATVTVPDAVKSVVEAAGADYATYFTKTATQVSDKTYTVKAELNPAAVFDSAYETAASMTEQSILDNAIKDATTPATVRAAKPGLYYSIEASNGLGFAAGAGTKEGKRVLATGTTVDVAKPATMPSGNAVFMRVKVSTTAE